MVKDLDFGLPFFYRVVLPGVLVAGLATPLAQRYRGLFSPNAAIDAWLALVGALVVGILLAALSDPIYELYEGRRGWPRALSSWLTARQAARVRDLRHRAEAAESAGDMAAYDEVWALLRQYPEDDNGDPTAVAPTRVGNILAAYEAYPSRRYGMDGVFYWYRLWLRVDDDVRQEIDRGWAATDAFMYLAFGMLTLGALYVISVVVALAIGIAIGPWLIVSSDLPAFLIAGVALVLLSYVPYRLSIPGHLHDGEMYKSLFDLYRGLLKDLGPASPEERKRWDDAWAALQYGVRRRRRS